MYPPSPSKKSEQGPVHPGSLLPNMFTAPQVDPELTRVYVATLVLMPGNSGVNRKVTGRPWEPHHWLVYHHPKGSNKNWHFIYDTVDGSEIRLTS